MGKIKLILSAIFGMLATFFDQYGILIVLVAVAIVFDLVTGLIKVKVSENDIFSSEKCRKGFYKKIALLLAMCFGFFLDMFSPYALENIHVTLPFNLPFSMVISFYIILNESISICENLYAANPDIMPKWIVSFLTNAKDKLDNKGNEELK